jgi:hypothetical protein
MIKSIGKAMKAYKNGRAKMMEKMVLIEAITVVYISRESVEAFACPTIYKRRQTNPKTITDDTHSPIRSNTCKVLATALMVKSKRQVVIGRVE